MLYIRDLILLKILLTNSGNQSYQTRSGGLISNQHGLVFIFCFLPLEFG